MLNTIIFHSYMQILVIFCGPSVVKVHVIRSIAYQIVNKDTLGGLILIVQNHITAQALKAVDLFPFKAEIFQVIYLFAFYVHIFPILFYLSVSHSCYVFTAVWLQKI